MKKRAYFVQGDKNDEFGTVIIGRSIKHVKKMVRENSLVDYDEYINITVKWMRDVPYDVIKDLPFGEVDEQKGLKRGLYSDLEID